MDPILAAMLAVAALLALLTAALVRKWSRLLPPQPTQVKALPTEPPQAPRPPDPQPTALVLRSNDPRALVPRSGTPLQRRWLVALSVAAPAVAVGAWVHHQRFVGYHARKGVEAVPPFGEWVRAELKGAAALGWWQVSGLLSPPALPPEARREGRLVVCVHGYTQNATNFVGLQRVLHEAGRPTRALTLGHLLAPMSWYAARLERHLRLLAADHPGGFDLVAHSMGGVVLRMVLAAHEDLRAPLRTVVTLGSPHRGTAAARGIPLLPEVRALKRRSALLAELPQLPELLPHARIVTVAGDADTVVYPTETAIVPGAEAVVLRGIGHAGLLTEPRAWVTVRAALQQEGYSQPT